MAVCDQDEDSLFCELGERRSKNRRSGYWHERTRPLEGGSHLYCPFQSAVRAQRGRLRQHIFRPSPRSRIASTGTTLAAAPSRIATAKARFSSITGDGSVRSSYPTRLPMHGFTSQSALQTSRRRYPDGILCAFGSVSDSTAGNRLIETGEDSMLYYALVFLILGLVASVLGAYGVAAVASQIAWVLFVIGIVLLVVHLISGRRIITP
jgi:uncharacterized membrane protein YtjA (UPF0391 family)